jgi:hypothetical protein
MAYAHKVKCACGTLTEGTAGAGTAAALIAGRPVIEGIPGRRIRIIDAYLISTGNAAGATSVDINCVASASVALIVVCPFTVAGLTTGTLLRVGTATTAIPGAGFNVQLTAGCGINLKTTGNLTTTTALRYCIKYVVT